ncbi:MAG: nucleotide exchange factor GrpE [Bacteroidetes bacterium]|nr:MAG: nucleotide exchange factor GrpE [Bacteroidota bacterium]
MKKKRPEELEQEAQDNIPASEENTGSNGETAENQPQSGQQKDEVQVQLDDMKSKYLYLLSDFENYKRNVAKERIELQQTAGRDIMTALLSVLDDFDRAAKNESLNEGTTLIHHKLLQILQQKGLSELECKAGDPFDADTQEAVAEIPAPTPDLKGKIVDVTDKGYRLGERIIRYAKVVVGM